MASSRVQIYLYSDNPFVFSDNIVRQFIFHALSDFSISSLSNNFLNNFKKIFQK